MNDKRKALGRGLEQLFNTENLDLNSFSINSKVKAINGDLYPREIEIDFKSKTININ